MKMQTKAYREGSVKCVDTQLIRMKTSWLMSFYCGLPQLATDHCTVAPSPGEHFVFASNNRSNKSKLKH